MRSCLFPNNVKLFSEHNNYSFVTSFVRLSAGRKHREDRNREYIRIGIVPIIHSLNSRDDINILEYCNCSDYYK